MCNCLNCSLGQGYRCLGVWSIHQYLQWREGWKRTREKCQRLSGWLPRGFPTPGWAKTLYYWLLFGFTSLKSYRYLGQEGGDSCTHMRIWVCIPRSHIALVAILGHTEQTDPVLDKEQAKTDPRLSSDCHMHIVAWAPTLTLPMIFFCLFLGHDIFSQQQKPGLTLRDNMKKTKSNENVK